MPRDPDKGMSSMNSKKFDRRSLLKISGVGGASLLAGCLGDDDDGDDTDPGDDDDGEVETIEFWRWPAATEPSNEASEALVEEFNETAGAEMNLQVEEVIHPFGDFEERLTTAIAGGDAPDVAWAHPAQLRDPAGEDREAIEEDAPFVYIDEYMDDEYRDHIMDAYWRWQERNYGGPVGIPFISLVSPGMLYVNVDAWEEAGLGDLPEDSWTIDEFHEALEAMHGIEVNDTTIAGFGHGFTDLAANTEWDNYLPLTRTFGDVLDEGYRTDAGDYALTMANDVKQEALDAWLFDPIRNGWSTDPLAWQWLEMIDQFAAGQVGMTHQTTFARVQFYQEADFEWAAVPYPTKDGEDYFLYDLGAQGTMFLVFREDVGGNPDNGWEWAKWRNNPENQLKWFNQSSQSIPSQEAYQRMLDGEASDFAVDSGAVDVMDQVMEASETLPDVINAREERFDIAVDEREGIKTVDMGIPLGVAGGRMHETVQLEWHDLVEDEERDVGDALLDIEEEWADLLADEDLDVREEYVGWNSPDPQAGPL